MRVASRSSSSPCTFCGSVIATLSLLPSNANGIATDALEHRQRDQLRRLGVDAGDGEVDERQVVLLGERPRDAERAGEALVDQRLRERVAGAVPLRLAELLGRQQPARRR